MENKDRDIKKLLELVLRRVEGIPFTHYNCGLCIIAYQLYTMGFFHISEYDKVKEYIENNRPKFYQKYYSYEYRNTGFYWDTTDKEIRIKWLKYHIKKLSN